MKLVVLVLAACGSKDEPPPTEPAPRMDLGSCSLEITSHVIASERPPSTVAETTPGSWDGKVIRCAGPDTSLTFTARRPLARGTHVVAPGSPIDVAGRVKEGRLSMTDGSLEITALDEAHVAGTFELRSVFSQDRSRISGKLKGSFEIARQR